MIETVENRQDITALQGETAIDLDGIATAAGATSVGTSIFISAANGGIWTLRIGTDPESSTIVRPFDFNAVTNAVVWELRFGPTTVVLAEKVERSLVSGDQTIIPGAVVHSEIITVTGAARTSVVSLAQLSATEAGWIFKARVNMPATAGVIIEIRDQLSGLLLYSLSSDDGGGSAFSLYFEALYTNGGQAWNPLFIVSPTT